MGLYADWVVGHNLRGATIRRITWCLRMLTSQRQASSNKVYPARGSADAMMSQPWRDLLVGLANRPAWTNQLRSTTG
jgi:hypothetical protein